MRRYHVLFKRNHETVMAMLAEHEILEHFSNTKYNEVLVRNYFKTESED